MHTGPMFRRPTTLVLGAAASFEFGLPLGGALLGQLIGKLNIAFDDVGNIISGSPNIWSAMLGLSNRGHINPEQFRQVALRLIKTAQIARSIDNAIHMNNDDPMVAVVGKLAICEAILEAERESLLTVMPGRPCELDWAKLRKTWLLPFAQMLTTDVQKSEVETVFDNLTIITFNYDRTIERVMPIILMDTYGLSSTDAEKIVSERLRVFHPYGQVGSLSYWNQTSVHVGFGEQRFGQLEDISHGILTFTEQVTDAHSDLREIRKAVQQAEQLIFLGFGYHEQNMTLLQPKQDCRAEAVFGTIYDEPEPAIGPIQQSVYDLMSHSGGPYKCSPALRQRMCVDFMADHFRPFTA